MRVAESKSQSANKKNHVSYDGHRFTDKDFF